ncbi:hypothetical protein K435DRAFT_789667 [Dendrothele bispora CBS 962.96]|uniref:Uncharacterized protein n=1 Tax=Dendrothele bispora (strain CBS 962.96) TaxID=1314807 RepID=A0A4S8MSW6_DENBC|nr:hypothetical protein K435DRAFT_789667 [Dendrothele bispora CBS 962.96]
MGSTGDVMIIMDDTLMVFSDQTQWKTSAEPLWYGGGSSWAYLSDSSSPATFTASFQGTSIAFVGNTPHPNSSQSFMIAIDGAQDEPVTYPEPEVNCQWYTSHMLNDSGSHQIVLSQLDKVSVDFAFITAGENTPLAGQTIIVDDSSPEINWSGQWQERSNQKFPAGVDQGRPFGNGTHASTNVGDSMTFPFAGTGIRVYGVFNWTVPGNTTATFTLDSNESSFKTFSSAFDRPPNVQSVSNFLFFESTDLHEGNHNLTIDVTEIVGEQSLIIDYLTYQPSFDSIKDKPDFSSGIIPDSTSSATGSPTSSPTAGRNGGVPARSPLPLAAIIGSVVGGVVLIVTLVAVFCWSRIRSRRSRKKARQYIEPPSRSREFLPSFNGWPSYLTYDGKALTGPVITYNALIMSQDSPSPSHVLSDTTDLVSPSKTSVSREGRHVWSSNDAKFDSPASIASGSVTLSTLPMEALSRELAALRSESYVEAIVRPTHESRSSPSVDHSDQIRRLEEVIEALARENELLGGPAVPPPSYRQ